MISFFRQIPFPLAHVIGAVAALLAGLLLGVGLKSPEQGPATPDTPATAETPDQGPPPPIDAAPDVMASRSPPRDWVDSLPVPGHVLTPYRGRGDLTRAYSRLDQPRPRPASSSAAIDPMSVRPVVLQRVSGSEVAAFDVGLGSSEATPVAGVWRIPGTCSSRLNLSSGWPSVQGRELGRMGSWIYALAVPDRACSAVDNRASARQPSATLRQEIAYAVAHDPVILAATEQQAFSVQDLQDLAVLGDVAWGVFRAPLRTTQIYPPPPRPQVAFIASRSASGTWQVAWMEYEATAARTLGLAGIYDLDGNGSPEALFGVRGSDGSGSVLILSGNGNRWSLDRNLPLGRVIRS